MLEEIGNKLGRSIKSELVLPVYCESRYGQDDGGTLRSMDDLAGVLR